MLTNNAPLNRGEGGGEVNTANQNKETDVRARGWDGRLGWGAGMEAGRVGGGGTEARRVGLPRCLRRRGFVAMQPRRDYDKRGAWREGRMGKRKGWGVGGHGGRVSVRMVLVLMKYSVIVCLRLLLAPSRSQPRLLLSSWPPLLLASLADSFIYWGPCGSGN